MSETTKLVERRKKEAEEAAARAAAAPKELDMSGPDQPEPEPAEEAWHPGRLWPRSQVGTKKVVTGISDRQALFDHLWPDPELMALMNRMAQRQVDAGLTVPGITIEEQAVVQMIASTTTPPPADVPGDTGRDLLSRLDAVGTGAEATGR